MKYHCQITHANGDTFGSVSTFAVIGKGYEITMKWFRVEHGKMFKPGDRVFVRVFIPEYKHTDIEEDFTDWRGTVTSVTYEGDVFVIRGAVDV